MPGRDPEAIKNPQLNNCGLRLSTKLARRYEGVLYCLNRECPIETPEPAAGATGSEFEQTVGVGPV